MELRAAIEALKVIPRGATGTIWADAEYVVHGAVKWRKRWQSSRMRTSTGSPVANQQLWESLWKFLDNRPNVVIRWTRGHDGTEGNEIVDRLARSSAERVKMGFPPMKMDEERLP
jgi:ribonuclease HI